MTKLSALSIFALSTALLLGQAHAGRAATVPVALTGFTDDVVANGVGSAQSSTTSDMDGGTGNFRYCFVAQDFVNPLGDQPQSSLPTGGLINSVNSFGVTYQLADYSAPNSLRLTGTSNGTLAFATPQAASLLYLLVASGNGLSTFDITITFTDQTTQVVGGLVADDWFGGSNYAIQGVSRVNYASDAIQNSTTDPRLYEVPVGIATANLRKPIASVTVNKTAGGPGTLNVMAISATLTPTGLAEELAALAPAAYPNPATSALTVDIPGANATQLHVTDLMGRTLLTVPVREGQARLSVSGLSSGAYLMQAQYRDGLRGRAVRFVRE